MLFKFELYMLNTGFFLIVYSGFKTFLSAFDEHDK